MSSALKDKEAGRPPVRSRSSASGWRTCWTPRSSTAVVAPDATYVSLNTEDAELNKIMPWAGTSHGPQAFLDNLGVMFSRWENQAFNVTTMFASDENVAVFGDFRYRSNSLGKVVSSPFSILVKVVDGKVTYLQFLEDSYATARSFRKDGSWTVQTEVGAEPFEVSPSSASSTPTARTSPAKPWNGSGDAAYIADPAQRFEITASPNQAMIEQLRGLPPTPVLVDEADVLREEDEAYKGEATPRRCPGYDRALRRHPPRLHDAQRAQPNQRDPRRDRPDNRVLPRGVRVGGCRPMTDAARISELMLINLFAVFNERDAERRSKAIAANYAEDVIWTDPEGTTRGHKAMNERAQNLLEGHARVCVHRRGADPRQPRSRPYGLQPRGARAAAGRQRIRRGAGARRTDRRLIHAGECRRLIQKA